MYIDYYLLFSLYTKCPLFSYQSRDIFLFFFSFGERYKIVGGERNRGGREALSFAPPVPGIRERDIRVARTRVASGENP